MHFDLQSCNRHETVTDAAFQVDLVMPATARAPVPGHSDIARPEGPVCRRSVPEAASGQQRQCVGDHCKNDHGVGTPEGHVGRMAVISVPGEAVDGRGGCAMPRNPAPTKDTTAHPRDQVSAIRLGADGRPLGYGDGEYRHAEKREGSNAEKMPPTTSQYRGVPMK